MKQSFILTILVGILTLAYISIPALDLVPALAGYLMILIAALIIILVFTLGETSMEDYIKDIAVIKKGLRYAAGDLGKASLELADKSRDVAKKGTFITFHTIGFMEKPVKTGFQKTLEFLGRFGLVLLLTGVVLILPTPEGLSKDGHHAIALFVFTATILALEPVSLPIAALMVPVALIALDLGEVQVAFGPFSRPVVFLILGSLFLAEALRKHGIARRLALMTIVWSKGNVKKILFGIMAIAGVLSMWVVSTATTAILIPVALTISRRIPDEDDAKKMLVVLVFGVAVAASVGGMGTIIGSPSNAVASGLLRDVMEWGFLDWMKYGIPAFFLLLPVSWLIMTRIVKISTENIDISHIKKELATQGKISRQEREIMGTLIMAGILWVGGAFIESALGLPKTLLSSAVVAILAVSYLSIRNIINWDDVKGVSWGVYLIIGAGLTLGETLSRTGVTEWLAVLLEPFIGNLPFLAVLAIIVFISALLTNVLNNTTIAAVFTPILISIALSTGQDPVKYVLPAVLATTFGYSLPSSSGRMAIVAATGIVSRKEMMRYGLILTIPSSILLILLFYFMSIIGVI